MVIYGTHAYPHGKYAYPRNSLRRSNLSARGSYNSSKGNSNFSNYKLRVMPYDEDLREDFLESLSIQPSNIAIYVLVGIVVIMYLFAVYLATRST